MLTAFTRSVEIESLKIVHTYSCKRDDRAKQTQTNQWGKRLNFAAIFNSNVIKIGFEMNASNVRK